MLSIYCRQTQYRRIVRSLTPAISSDLDSLPPQKKIFFFIVVVVLSFFFALYSFNMLLPSIIEVSPLGPYCSTCKIPLAIEKGIRDHLELDHPNWWKRTVRTKERLRQQKIETIVQQS